MKRLKITKNENHRILTDGHLSTVERQYHGKVFAIGDCSANENDALPCLAQVICYYLFEKWTVCLTFQFHCKPNCIVNLIIILRLFYLARATYFPLLIYLRLLKGKENIWPNCLITWTRKTLIKHLKI